MGAGGIDRDESVAVVNTHHTLLRRCHVRAPRPWTAAGIGLLILVAWTLGQGKLENPLVLHSLAGLFTEAEVGAPGATWDTGWQRLCRKLSAAGVYAAQ